MINQKALFNLALIMSISLLFVFTLVSISAVSIDEVEQDSLYPGEYTTISITLQNNLNANAEDISFNLVFSSDSGKSLGFTSAGTSEKSIISLNEDKSKTIDLDVKASNSLEPGDYNLPYVLSYKLSGNSTLITKTGTIGVTVNSKTKLDFIALTNKPVIGQESKISLKIINKGFGEVKFVSVNLAPVGFTLLSEKNVYVGSISSDDFQTADYTVIFDKKNPILSAVVTYRDFENNEKTENVNLDMRAYTQEEALKLGYVTPSKLPLIITIVIIVLVVVFVRKVIKRKKKNNLTNTGKK